MVEILKQGQYQPLSVDKQVILIYAATQGFVDALPTASLGRYEKELYEFLTRKYPQIYTEIETKKALTDDIKKILVDALKEFQQIFDPSKKA